MPTRKIPRSDPKKLTQEHFVFIILLRFQTGLRLSNQVSKATTLRPGPLKTQRSGSVGEGRVLVASHSIAEGLPNT